MNDLVQKQEAEMVGGDVMTKTHASAAAMNRPDWRQQEEIEQREQAERKWSEHKKQARDLEQLRRDIEAIRWSKTA